MKRIVIKGGNPIPPFGEAARDLRILNKPLWLLQRDLLTRYCRGALEVDSLEEIPQDREELLVHRDNLFFNEHLIDAFISQAKASGHACQIAFSRDDKAIVYHALPLQEGIKLHPRGHVYVADLFYYPNGISEEPQPLVIDTEPREMGYYHIPSYMAPNQGDLIFQVPRRAFLSIENWMHVFMANSPFGVFSMGRIHEQLVEESWKEKLSVSLATLGHKLNPFAPGWRNNFLASSRLVKIGKNCSIDPTAIIHGPTIIGNNVTIGAGAVITNSLIGNNVNIMQGCQVMLSVVSDRCYLPWNTALFMSSLMENTMIAQLTCLQMCVVGRNTFIGAGNIFTDFHLLNEPLRTYHNGELVNVELPVLGSAVGHNCRIGSGFVVYPGRMIGSNSTLIYGEPSTVISRNVNITADGDTELDEFGEPARTVFVWPHSYDMHTRTIQYQENQHTAPAESLPLSVPESASVGHRRTSR